MAIQPLRILTWNLFHGRDAPPEPALLGARGALSGCEAVGERYAQVRRSLFAEFARVLDGEDWDVALLQEAPPRWLAPLARATRAHAAGALTARNLLPAPRALVAARRPDLLGSWEGGSNQLLVRPPWRIVELHRLTVRRRPERRRALIARLHGPGGRALVVANVHASVSHRRPEADVDRTAAAAVTIAAAGPLVLGGDLNLRPRDRPESFARLEDRHGLAGATAPDAIDHLLVRELETLERARELPASWREIERADGRLVRLSDHAPVIAGFGMR